LSTQNNTKRKMSTVQLPHVQDELMTGTSIMAVAFKGGVVMGADSRTTTGSYIANRASDKIDKLHDRIYCCRSGSAADTQAISAMVQYYLSAHAMEAEHAPRVKTAASLFQELCYTNKDRLLAGIIVAGWDKYEGGQVYVLPLGGSLVRQPYALGGSGSTYIYGLVDSTYHADMTREECEQFIIRGLSHAMARDGSSGGVIRLTTITENSVESKFLPGNKLPYIGEQHI
jgi:20S proteasome subunit beta 1